MRSKTSIYKTPPRQPCQNADLLGVSCKLMFCLAKHQFTRHPYQSGKITSLQNDFVCSPGSPHNRPLVDRPIPPGGLIGLILGWMRTPLGRLESTCELSGAGGITEADFGIELGLGATRLRMGLTFELTSRHLGCGRKSKLIYVDRCCVALLHVCLRQQQQ